MALTDKLRAIADAIRGKTGGTEEMTLDQMAAEIEGIESGGDNSGLLAVINDTVEGEFYNAELTKMINHLFSGCKLLTKVELPEITEVTEYAFYNCSGLTEARFTKAKYIYNFSFENCTRLRKIVAPNVIRLVNYCFKNCSALEIVDCAPTTAINNMNFATTTSLAHLVLRTNSVCTLDNASNLSATKIASGAGYIYVPSALVDSYKTATNWSAYAEQFRVLEDYTIDGTITGELDETKI